MRHASLVRIMLLALLMEAGPHAWGQYFPWTKDPLTPILSGGAPGAWNMHIFQPCALYNQDSARFEMWFNTSPGPLSVSKGRPWSVGFATSPDGVQWDMYPSPVISPDSGSWDARCVAAPYVLREAGQYKMWYSGWPDETSPSYVGYASSPDGIHWEKFAFNPIMLPGTTNAWDAGGPVCGSVMAVPGGYRMWYMGYSGSYHEASIGVATSPDTVSWITDPHLNPVLDPGTVGQWDADLLFFPRVLWLNGRFEMWYSGQRQVGHAWSEDGLTGWAKDSLNPVLGPSSFGWDASWVGNGAVVMDPDPDHDRLYMLHDGYGNTNRVMIGRAWAPTTAVTDVAGLPGLFMLAQNYPNPFNPSTTIAYELPKSSAVRLSVYDMLGREVSVLVNERKNAGWYEVKFDAAGLSSGVYLYRLTAGEFVRTRKMVLVR